MPNRLLTRLGKLASLCILLLVSFNIYCLPLVWIYSCRWNVSIIPTLPYCKWNISIYMFNTRLPFKIMRKCTTSIIHFSLTKYESWNNRVVFSQLSVKFDQYQISVCFNIWKLAAVSHLHTYLYPHAHKYIHTHDICWLISI